MQRGKPTNYLRQKSLLRWLHTTLESPFNIYHLTFYLLEGKARYADLLLTDGFDLWARIFLGGERGGVNISSFFLSFFHTLKLDGVCPVDNWWGEVNILSKC